MSSNQYSYVIKGLTKIYPGGRDIFKNVWLSFYPGAKIGIIGVNGSGKSTLMRIMAGMDKDFSGEAWAADGVKVGYLSQEPELDPTLTVQENVTAGLAEMKALMDRFDAVSARFGETLSDDEMNALIAEQGELQEKIDAVDGWDLNRKIEIAMDALRCPPGDADVTKLSGGERNRVHLAKMLQQGANLLLLDEPTNDLDVETLRALEEALLEFAGCAVVISHDRFFLDRISTHILAFEGDSHVEWFEGNYQSYEEDRKRRLGHAADQPHRIKYKPLMRKTA
ncbi:Putative ABC transporter ATP-binding protein [Candidatus Bealeia paramacronuclearis]|uniref:ABC transporter ATP-binding protein n=1 Tax=Candidatus Bealeia paramacronuclearis TaxID=1921001 RepID=A0ABZ2C2Q0_9PROT|nr:putative ABC transporter ATP-binding protein [Candidatus Bealeia paramacronuclearis]